MAPIKLNITGDGESHIGAWSSSNQDGLRGRDLTPSPSTFPGLPCWTAGAGRKWVGLRLACLGELRVWRVIFASSLRDSAAREAGSLPWPASSLSITRGGFLGLSVQFPGPVATGLVMTMEVAALPVVDSPRYSSNELEKPKLLLRELSSYIRQREAGGGRGQLGRS